MGKEKKSGKRKPSAMPYEGIIVAISLPAGTPYKERARFFRQLYGYTDNSQYGKYSYRREGLLDRVGYVRFSRGVFIIRKDALATVKRFMKGKAKIATRMVKLTAKDRKRLKGKTV